MFSYFFFRKGDESKKICQEAPQEAQAPVSTSAPITSFEGDDAAAWEAMLSVMNRKPFEAWLELHSR